MHMDPALPANLERANTRQNTEDRSQLTLLLLSALLFALTATLTIKWCIAMAAMDDMSIVRRGASCVSEAAGLLSCLQAQARWMTEWTVMMVAMMLPSLVPSLESFRRSLAGARQQRVDALTVALSAGYFLVWGAAGIAVLGLHHAAMELAFWQPAFARFGIMADTLAVLLGGMVQLSSWKARQLAQCRRSERTVIRPDAAVVWRRGMRLGRYCIASCAPIMSLLLVTGIMDLRGMICVTAAITAERLGPFGERLTRPIGAALTVAGLVWIGRVL